jgi:hypothetical protein
MAMTCRREQNGLSVWPYLRMYVETPAGHLSGFSAISVASISEASQVEGLSRTNAIRVPSGDTTAAPLTSQMTRSAIPPLKGTRNRSSDSNGVVCAVSPTLPRGTTSTASVNMRRVLDWMR